MADGRYESVSTFVLPNEYQRQATEARRRRRMAEMLAQQAYQPSDISAPIPAAAPLVQGLQAFLAARAERKADEAEEAAKETASREARQYLKALTEEDTTTDATQPEGPTAPPTVTMPQFEGGRIMAPASIEMGAPPPMVAPQVQLSRYNLTPGQRRAAALEGMLSSQNPMIQNIGSTIYPTLQPEKTKLQLGNIDPAKFTPASIAQALKTGNVSDLRAISPPSESRIGKPSPGDFTPRSLAEFEKTGDPNVLVPVPKVAPTTNIINRYGAPMAAVDAKGNPVFIQASQTGGEPSVLKGFAPPSPNATATASEQTTAWNVGRFINAANEISDAVAQNPNAIKPSGKEVIAEVFGETAAGGVRDPQRQIVVGAQADMLDALITLATGAAYTVEQKEAAKQTYIPSYTDKPETIAAKRQRLLNLIPDARTRAGTAWTPALEERAKQAIDSVAPAPKSKLPDNFELE